MHSEYEPSVKPLRTQTAAELLATDIDELEARDRRRLADLETGVDREAEVEVLIDEMGLCRAWQGDLLVGELLWNSKGQVLHIEVHPGLRRLGIATRMWNKARDAGVELLHSSDRTEAGDAWAKSVGGDLPALYLVTAEFDSPNGWGV